MGKKVYVMLPVRPQTKKLVDEFKDRVGAKSYDEAIAKAVKPAGGNELLKSIWGICPGLPPFVREKNDRDLSRFIRSDKRD